MTLALFNAHARATALSVVWDEIDQQLVAAVFSALDKALLTALKAELEKNGVGRLHLRHGEQTVALTGARRGYARAGIAHEKFHSHGSTLAVQHWKALDPREVLPPPRKKDDDAEPREVVFYVVATADDCLTTLFGERLQLALTLPLQTTWAAPLLALGQAAGLVQPLAIAHHPDLPDNARRFTAGLRVVKDNYRWQTDIITPALERGQLTL